MKKTNLLPLAASVLAFSLMSQNAFATCQDIQNSLDEKGFNLAALTALVKAKDSGGFGLPMWVTAVDETGKVCWVINSSGEAKNNNGRSNSSWLGSRVISAQKANTANAFSLDDFSISTANLYGLTLPGGSLYELPFSNPVDASRAYAGSPNTYGTNKDPLKNKRIGGVNVFGGGLALYHDMPGVNGTGKMKVGAIGVSGDTSCTDHAVAWKIRHLLGLDNVPAGFNDLNGSNQNLKGDEILIKTSTVTPNTIEHPTCVSAPTGSVNGVFEPSM